LIDASIKALSSNEKSDDTMSDMQQHWALLRRCMKKKSYAAELLAEAGGTYAYLKSFHRYTNTTKKKTNTGIELIINSIKDQSKDNIHLNGALNLMPYFTLNASDAVRNFRAL